MANLLFSYYSETKNVNDSENYKDFSGFVKSGVDIEQFFSYIFGFSEKFLDFLITKHTDYWIIPDKKVCAIDVQKALEQVKSKN